MKKFNIHFLTFFIVLLSVAISDVIIYFLKTNYLVTEIASIFGITILFIILNKKKKIEIKSNFSKFDLIFIIGLVLYMISKIVFPDLSWDTRSYHIYLQENVFIDKINYDFFAGRNLNSFLFALGDRVNYLFRYLLGYRTGTIFSYYTILVLFYQIKNILKELTKSENELFISIFSILPCISSIIFSFSGTYYIDNFGVVLILEVIGILLFEKEIIQNKIKLYTLFCIIGLAISIKITNIVFIIPFGIFYLINNIKELKNIKIYDFIFILLLSILPWFVYALDSYIQTGNPVFPYYNNIFKSELFKTTEWKDTNFGPTNIIQFIIWPVYIVFNPIRAFDTKFVDIMWGIGFAIILLYIGYCFIKGYFKENKKLVLAIGVLITYYIWEKLLIGYVRYASILLVLSFIISISIIYTQFHNKKWISIILSIIIFVACIPSIGYDFLIVIKDFNSLSEFTEEYKKNFSMIIKDREEKNLDNDMVLAAIGDDSLIPTLLRNNNKIYNLEEWVTITNDKTKAMYNEKIYNHDFLLYVDAKTLDRKKDYLNRNNFEIIEESEEQNANFLSPTDALYKLVVRKKQEPIN